jgi:hypothetical protein
LQTAAQAVFDQGGHSVADIALQAAALLAVKLGSYYDLKRAPRVILALLKIANDWPAIASSAGGQDVGPSSEKVARL